MLTLIRFSWLGLILLHFVPGFSGWFFFEFVLAGMVAGVTSALLNEFGMIPGTKPYEIKHKLHRAKCNLEIDRIELARTRLRERESKEIARTLALTKGEDVELS